MSVTSTRIEVVPLRGDLVAGCVEVCASSLERTAARIRAPWLSPPASAAPGAEQMVRSFLDAEAEGRLGWVAVDPARDGVLAFAGATITELTPDDWRFTFMPPRSVSVGISSCHSTSDAAAQACYPLLLDAVRSAATERDIRRISVQCAPGDTAAAAVWRRLHLEPDARMALRHVDSWRPPMSRSGASVRLAGSEDVEALTDLALEEHLYHAHHTGAGTSPDQPRETSRRLAADAVADTLADNARTRQLVAELAGAAGPDGAAPRVVGSAVGMLAELDDEDIRRHFMPARYGYIGLTSVTASARGAGVGRLLVDGLMRWFAEQGLELAFLHYVVDNPLSARFWSGLGFEPHIEMLTLR
jgi:GNAT superfamily N-acetyltransferase